MHYTLITKQKTSAFAVSIVVASVWGYKYPLVVSFLAGLIAIIFALQLKEVPIHNEPMKISVLLETFRNPCVLIPAFFAIILQLILQGTIFSFTSAVAEGLGASRFEIGINTALYTIVQVAAGAWIGKHFVKRAGDTGAIFSGFMCMSISCILTGVGQNIWYLYLAQIVGGIGNIIVISLLMAMAIRTVPTERKSTAMGLFQALYGIGMTAGPVLIGRMAEVWSFSTGYLVYGGISCGTSLAALVLIPWMNRKAELMSS